MTTTHVFIVDENTFPIHLKYMFAGTGAGEDGHENIGMIEDIGGCREGDKVIFYLTQHRGQDGKFFGVFEVVSNAFWDKEGAYLLTNLKPLTNRIFIKPFEIYSKGVSEWDALDNLQNLPNGIKSPANEMIWSLIYRKLEALRGCTPIFNYEYEQLLSLIRKVNNDKILKNVKNYDFENEQIKELNDDLLNYNKTKITKSEIPLIDEIKGITYSPEEKIIKVKNGEFKYEGKYKGRTITKMQSKCEAELEYFFVKNIGFDERINKIVGDTKDLVFWGSQIFCGVGKRRIDVLSISKENELKIIELKDEIFLESQLEQIKKYIIWATQYIRKPDKKTISPILILYDSEESIKNYKDKIESFNKEIKKLYDKVNDLKIFKWDIEKDKIYFTEVIY